MNPQQPQFRLIRSSRLPMKPVTPEDLGWRCIKCLLVDDTYGESVREKNLSDGRRTRIESAKVKLADG